jgi:hypothetical protein
MRARIPLLRKILCTVGLMLYSSVADVYANLPIWKATVYRSIQDDKDL